MHSLVITMKSFFALLLLGVILTSCHAQTKVKVENHPTDSYYFPLINGRLEGKFELGKYEDYIGLNGKRFELAIGDYGTEFRGKFTISVGQNVKKVFMCPDFPPELEACLVTSSDFTFSMEDKTFKLFRDGVEVYKIKVDMNIVQHEGKDSVKVYMRDAPSALGLFINVEEVKTTDALSSTSVDSTTIVPTTLPPATPVVIDLSDEVDEEAPEMSSSSTESAFALLATLIMFWSFVGY